jgi:hypothetical protein
MLIPKLQSGTSEADEHAVDLDAEVGELFVDGHEHFLADIRYEFVNEGKYFVFVQDLAIAVDGDHPAWALEAPTYLLAHVVARHQFQQHLEDLGHQKDTFSSNVALVFRNVCFSSDSIFSRCTSLNFCVPVSCANVALCFSISCWKVWYIAIFIC